MKVTQTIQVMNQIIPDKVLLLKVGEFFYQYGKDAYILAYLFDYKIKTIENNIPFSGFPKSALNKVITNLENNKLSYFIVDKSLNYEVLEEQNFKKKNNYIEIYNKAHKYILKKNKIEKIYEYLNANINQKNIQEKILKIEEILYEV